MKQIIIIPAYNEEKRIERTLKAFLTYYKKKHTLETLFLVAINNTTDNTLTIVKRLQKENKSLFYLNLPKGGKGYAVIEGFKWALKKKSDYIGFVDADLATSPQAFDDLIKHIENAEGIIASRYLPGAIVSPKPTIKRIIASRIYNLLIRTLFLFPYHDTQCGAKLFKAEAIKKVISELVLASWSFDVDLLYHFRKKGYEVKELPTIWSDQAYSKVSLFTTGSSMALSMFYLRLYHSPLRLLLPVSRQ